MIQTLGDGDDTKEEDLRTGRTMSEVIEQWLRENGTSPVSHDKLPFLNDRHQTHQMRQ